VWSRLGEHGRLGSLKAGSVLCVFGPSLFGYIWVKSFSYSLVIIELQL